ncbi:MAG: exopolysaccharide biosynthesis polyprenyl glycosylphosphotransferase [Patescibacteria group bacterium]|jgi:exopolysaccharide biosynthesis polyprenyl glycosylphosphotransferase
MKKIDLFLSFILVPLDFALIVLAGISAYFIRFSEFTTEIRPIIFDLPFLSYFKVVLFIALLWVIIFAISALYSTSSRRLSQEIYRVFLACSAGFVLVVALIFFQRELFSSRFIVLVAWILAIFYVSLGRTLIYWIKKIFYSYGVGVKNIILVGCSKTGDNLIKEFFNKKYSGFKVIKRVRDFSIDTAKELSMFITNFNKENLNKEERVDEIIQSDPNLSKIETLRLYDFANEHHITFKYVADLLEVKVLKTEVSEMAGIPIVEVKKTTLDGWGRIVKRIFDIFFSGIFIIILSPIIIITIILIKIDSHGPVFFTRRDDGSFVFRVGQGGEPFRYFKFRSMIPGTDSMRYNELSDKNIRKDGPMVKIEDDPRVTRVGRFIRRWSIDELPELFLVFIGRMSLVGPRPHLPEEVAKYEQHHKKTLTVKPGITGLAQVSGRSDLLFEEEVKLDVYYIENWSLLLDLSILLRTPLAVFRNRKVE